MLLRAPFVTVNSGAPVGPLNHVAARAGQDIGGKCTLRRQDCPSYQPPLGGGAVPRWLSRRRTCAIGQGSEAATWDND